MKRRIIINIDATDEQLTDLAAIDLVARLIAGGRVSSTAGRKHYCALATLSAGGQIHATKRNDTTDTFSIWK